MNIFHVSAECYPIAKVGGLADVVGALPKYQTALQHQVKVVIPKYKTTFVNQHKFKNVFKGELKLGVKSYPFTVETEPTNALGYEMYLIDIPPFFETANVYEGGLDSERFVSFQIAFLNWLIESKQFPDMIHIHDHHTGLIPFMLKFAHAYKALSRVPTFLTIHNAQYHGSFGFEKLHFLPEFDHSKIGFLEWNGQINPLAAAIKCVWQVSTVSPSYLEEMSFSANGLEDLLRHERPKSIGILNGIDVDVWNPQTDTYLVQNYSTRSFKKGKEANKAALCEQFDLDPKKPLFAFIGRLVGEKGADLLPHICSIVLNDFHQQVNILILGSGDPEVERHLQRLTPIYKGNYNAYIGYNEQVSHQIYAGTDFLLMPSRVEPCGLNQMYALRYGTVPIVRRTGGLKDTIIDIGDFGYGICHDQASVEDVVYSIGRGIGLYKDEENMDKVIKTGMKINHSWEKVANTYLEVYKELIVKTADSW
jgi:starch synthase